MSEKYLSHLRVYPAVLLEFYDHEIAKRGLGTASEIPEAKVYVYREPFGHGLVDKSETAEVGCRFRSYVFMAPPRLLLEEIRRFLQGSKIHHVICRNTDTLLLRTSPIVFSLDFKKCLIIYEIGPHTYLLARLLAVPMCRIHLKIRRIVINRGIRQQPLTAYLAYTITCLKSIFKDELQLGNRRDELGIYAVHEGDG